MISLLAITLASAADESRWRPLTIVSGVVFRQNTTTGTFVAAGVEAADIGVGHVDVVAHYTAHHIFTLPGPRRTYGSVDGLLDLAFDIGPYLSTGPTAGVGLRLFRQQFTPIDRVLTGLYGWKVDITTFRSKPIGLVMQGRVLADTRRIDLVLATSQVQRMPQLEVRFGLGLVIGPRRRE